MISFLVQRFHMRFPRASSKASRVSQSSHRRKPSAAISSAHHQCKSVVAANPIRTVAAIYPQDQGTHRYRSTIVGSTDTRCTFDTCTSIGYTVHRSRSSSALGNRPDKVACLPLSRVRICCFRGTMLTLMMPILENHWRCVSQRASALHEARGEAKR